MRRIFIMRHAQPDNPNNVVYGDLPGFGLNETGISQAKEAGEFMKNTPIDLIVTSNLDRAIQTGHLVGDLNSNQPSYIIDPRLRDNHMGELSGKITLEEYEANWQGYWEIRSKGISGTETPMATQARMIESFNEHTSRHPDKNILFVSHGDPIAFLVEALTSTLLEPSYPSNYLKKASICEVFYDAPTKVDLIFEPHVSN